MCTLEESVEILNKPRATVYWHIKKLDIKGTKQVNPKTKRKATYYSVDDLEKLKTVLDCSLKFSEMEVEYQIVDKYKKLYRIEKICSDKCNVYKVKNKVPNFQGWSTFEKLEKAGMIERV